jgi:hypothetical protein
MIVWLKLGSGLSIMKRPGGVNGNDYPRIVAGHSDIDTFAQVKYRKDFAVSTCRKD